VDQISINISQFAIMVFFYINQSIHLQRSHMLTQNYIHVNLKGILFDISSNYSSHFFPNLSCNARPKSLEFPTIRVSSYMWVLTIFIQTHPTFLLTNNLMPFPCLFQTSLFISSTKYTHSCSYCCLTHLWSQDSNAQWRNLDVQRNQPT